MIKILLVAAAVVAAAGCGRPRTIPRDDLKRIFKDAFLVNAYYETRPVWSPFDSLDMYRPVLARYGYQVSDLEYTVNRFARQKSSKLSDVVERAIGELSAESNFFDRRTAVADTLYAIADRMLGREVMFAERIEARAVRDTSALRIKLPVEEGDYRVEYAYFVDSLDRNRGLRTTATLVDTAGVRRRQVSFDNVNHLSPRAREHVDTRTITAGAGDRELEIVLGGYPSKELKTPHITIDSLRITHFPPRRKALDSVASRWLGVAEFEIPHVTQDSTQNSGALRPYDFGVGPVAGGDAR